jgi:GT2 family glycosyltransferase/tetratricopeptide (TPR) repeat protein
MSMYEFMIVIPTVAEPDTLVPTFERVLRNMDGTRTLLVLSVNPMSQQRAAETLNVLAAMKELLPRDCRVEVRMHEGPVGFACAVNSGIEAGVRINGGCTPVTIVLNDDVAVTPGWQRGLQAALDTETVRLYGEPSVNGIKPARSATDYGTIGLAGPASDNVAGIQAIPMSPEERQIAMRDPDGYAARFRQMNADNCMAADFLSGFCIALTGQCLIDLAERMDESGHVSFKLFDEQFGIGGFEDNDLCVRAEAIGWRAVVAGDTFVHHRAHQTLDKFFAGQQRGLANRLTYYEKWAQNRKPASEMRIGACYRIGWRFANDIHLTRASIVRTATVSDSINVVLTGNPLEVLSAFDFETAKPTLRAEDRVLLQACSGVDESGVRDAFEVWVKACVALGRDKVRSQDVWVEVWTGEWNERDERNSSIAMAEETNADWILSVDHDEVLEDRITRKHFERLMSHPDPLVRSWDFGWLNHWDSTRLCRVDMPWSDGLNYLTGMRGFRFWRANSRRIQAGTENGLHCGNCPDHDALAKRISGIRFRHYGYLRAEDRSIKAAQYRQLDKQFNSALTGNTQGYSHLTREEGMMFAPYVANNAIGLTALVHAGESVEDVARWLDAAFGIVDRIVLVWTDTDIEQPTTAMQRLGELFGVEWVRHKFEFDLAACRNAGLDRLREHKDIAWAWIVDPDEFLADPWQATTFRRMAENSDSYGFMMRFANHRPSDTNEPPTMSESVRFIRLDDDGVMRYSGRVHEGFDDAMRQLNSMGVHPQVRMCPVVIHHPGLAGDDASTEAKLRKYTKMLLLELQDNPGNTGAWVSLGLQYTNEGRSDEALVCYERALSCAGNAFLPFKELALWHLRQAKTLVDCVVERVAPAHGYYKIARDMQQWLHTYAPGQPIVGNARQGKSTSDEWLPNVNVFIGDLKAQWDAPTESATE